MRQYKIMEVLIMTKKTHLDLVGLFFMQKKEL